MSRKLILAYGIAVYALFFATFLYAFGFIGSLIVPKGINDGEPGAFWPSLVLNASFLLLFAIQHVVMARPAFKDWFTRFIPRPAERSTFVLAACAILILMFWLWRPLPEVVWQVQSDWLVLLLRGAFLLGMAIVLYSSFLIDHFDLFGLRQVVLHALGKPYTQKPFVVRSLYRHVRHPLMVGFLLAFWATPVMTEGHLLFALLTTGYILVGTRIEERDLVRQHGESYLAYRRTTPGLIPRLTPAARTGTGSGAPASPAF